MAKAFLLAGLDEGDIPLDALPADTDYEMNVEWQEENAKRRDLTGPLASLIPVFIDIETYYNKKEGVMLAGHTLRQYFGKSWMESVAIAIGDDDVQVFYAPEAGDAPADCRYIDDAFVHTLYRLATDPRFVFVAHNAAFDTRGLRQLLGIPHPCNVWCTMEGAMGAWPELPGGFSLMNLSKKLQLPKNMRKLSVDLDSLTKVRAKCMRRAIHANELRETEVGWITEVAKADPVLFAAWDGVTVTEAFCNALLGIYNVRDVVAMRVVFYKEVPRLSVQEQRIALLTHRQRGHFFKIEQGRLEEMIVMLDKNSWAAAKAASEYLVETHHSELMQDTQRGLATLSSIRDAKSKKAKGNTTAVSVIDQTIMKLAVNPEDEVALREASQHIADATMQEVFNRGEDGTGDLSSVRYARLKKVINEHVAIEEFQSVSFKKISPIQLGRNPGVREILNETTRVGKMLSHKRRSVSFRGVDEVDVELGYFRAHSGRFSSPTPGGRGLNLHNCVHSSSMILTDRGWVNIMALNKEDKVWDGQEFVEFAQVTPEGRRSTIKVGAAEITPEQPVWTGTQRIPADELTHWQRVQCVADGLSSSLRGLLQVKSESAAMDAAQKLYAWLCTSIKRSDAAAVRIREALESRCPGWRETTWHSSVDGSTTSAIGHVRTPTRNSTPSVLQGLQPSALASTSHGWPTQNCTLSTYRPFLDGLIEVLRSIVSTTNADTNPATSDSLLRSLTRATKGILRGLRPAKRSAIIASGSAFHTQQGKAFSAQDVFDIRGAGPRARFVANCAVCFNCPKHDKLVAEPVRRTFRLPDDKCFVRGDLANVEYRIGGYLTQCPTILNMFDPSRGGNINADPYMEAWFAMTGFRIPDKKHPVRQVSKSAVLGLSFTMSAPGYAEVLLKALHDRNSGVTEDLLRQTVLESGWNMPQDGGVQYIEEKCGCSRLVAVAAYHIHRLFNQAHPENMRFAKWLVAVMSDVAACGVGQIGRDAAARAIDRAYNMASAPDRNLVDLLIDDDPIPQRPSVRVKCGPWSPTVCWREPKMRSNPFDLNAKGPRLTIRKAAGRVGSFKAFTPPLAIENVVQSAARNALCTGLLQLDDAEYRDVLHIHDEIMLIVPREREAVLHARDALLDVYGPKHTMPYAWSILVKPSEVSVTASLYEDEDDFAVPYLHAKSNTMRGNDRWGKIERNELGCLEQLP